MSDTLSITTLREGAAIQMIDEALAKALSSIADTATDPKKARKVVLTITLASDDRREIVDTDITVETKLPGPKGEATTIILGYDSRGEMTPTEVVSRQTTIDDRLAAVTPLRKE